jgi:hypothetical protein
VRLSVFCEKCCKYCCIDGNRTAVSGSYVTAECAAYPVKGEGPFLVTIVMLFSVRAW